MYVCLVFFQLTPFGQVNVRSGHIFIVCSTRLHNHRGMLAALLGIYEFKAIASFGVCATYRHCTGRRFVSLALIHLIEIQFILKYVFTHNISVLAAVMSPQLVLILSLVGSFSLSYLGLIFPGLMDFCLRYGQGFGPYKIYLWQDISLVIFGFIGGGVGTWFSLSDIYANYQLQQWRWIALHASHWTEK